MSLDDLVEPEEIIRTPEQRDESLAQFRSVNNGPVEYSRSKKNNGAYMRLGRIRRFVLEPGGIIKKDQT